MRDPRLRGFQKLFTKDLRAKLRILKTNGKLHLQDRYSSSQTRFQFGCKLAVDDRKKNLRVNRNRPSQLVSQKLQTKRKKKTFFLTYHTSFWHSKVSASTDAVIWNSRALFLLRFIFLKTELIFKLRTKTFLTKLSLFCLL